jgi:hypothetical protein
MPPSKLEVIAATTGSGKDESMFSKTVKWTAIAALIAGAILHSSADLAFLMQFIAVAAPIVVLIQAATMGRYIWMTLSCNRLHV